VVLQRQSGGHRSRTATGSSWSGCAASGRWSGARGEDVVTFSFSLPPSKYPDRESRRGFLDGAIERLTATPGVLVVGAQNRDVLSQGAKARLELDGETSGLYDGLVDVREISDGYFGALSVGRRRGLQRHGLRCWPAQT